MGGHLYLRKPPRLELERAVDNGGGGGGGGGDGLCSTPKGHLLPKESWDALEVAASPPAGLGKDFIKPVAVGEFENFKSPTYTREVKRRKSRYFIIFSVQWYIQVVFRYRKYEHTGT